MITVTEFDSLISEMTAATAAEGYALVVNEKHLVKKLSDKTGIQIGAVIPSADAGAKNEDNFGEDNICFLFILEKKDPGSMNELEELAHYQAVQNVASACKNWLRNKKLEGDERMEYLDLNSIHTDPEYQFGGWNGWSVNFQFESDGF